MKELSKKYEPKKVEENKYDFWLEGGYFLFEVFPIQGMRLQDLQ